MKTEFFGKKNTINRELIEESYKVCLSHIQVLLPGILHTWKKKKDNVIQANKGLVTDNLE